MKETLSLRDFRETAALQRFSSHAKELNVFLIRG